MEIGKLQPHLPPLAEESAVSTLPKPVAGRESADLGKIPDLPPDTITEGNALSLGQSALAGLDLGPFHPDVAGIASPPPQPVPPSDPPPTDPSRLGASPMTASSLLAGVNLSRHHQDQSRMPAPAATDVGSDKPAPPPLDDARIRGFAETKAAGDLVKGLLHQQLSAKLPEAVPHPDPGALEAGSKSSGMISDLTGANQLGVVVEDHPQGVFSPASEPAGHPDPGSLEAGSKSSGMSSDLTGANQLGVVVEDHPQGVFSSTLGPAGHPDSGALEAGSKSSGMSSELTGADRLGLVVED